MSVTASRPIDLRPLFPEERAIFLTLLAVLTADEWHLPTVCTGWTVHDLAVHLLGIDVQILSGGRDGYGGPPNQPPPGDLNDWDTLVAFIDGRNAAWVEAMRRVSPRLTRELLTFTGDLVTAYLATIDMDAPAIPVSWAGPDPAPTWLHIAREYTERWVHHQQIRDATNRPGFTAPRFFAPVLDAFARALPHTLCQTLAPTGTLVRLTITGPAGNTWTALRAADHWHLTDDHTSPAAAAVTLDQDLAWRLFTKGLDAESAPSGIQINGDHSLATPVARMVTIMA
jgi:uncharacterized protein (TIGR03083 family)